MRKPVLVLFLFVALLCMDHIAAANSAMPDDFNTWLLQLHTLEAHYQQVTRDGGGHVLQQSHGKLSLQQPKHLYWSSRGDQNYEIVTKGGIIWYYDQDLQQITRQSFDKLSPSNPIWLLSGNLVTMQKQYKISIIGSPQSYRVQLKAKAADSAMSKAEFSIEKSQLRYLSFVDALDQTTTITLSRQKMNTPIQAERFNFTPPKGVDILDEVPA